jgi:4-hydroxy-3-polyprenylbenzoate decarboxylase
MHLVTDVVIKEQKKLILVPRESPYSAIHLENMLKLSRLRMVIMDTNPAFYQNLTSIQDMVDFVVA